MIVPLPHKLPMLSTAFKWRTYLPNRRVIRNGTIETKAPIIRTPHPICLRAGTNAAPALKPTQPMKRFNPRLLSSHRTDAGMFPFRGCWSCHQPKNNPAKRAPPPAPRVSGMALIVRTMEPIKIPTTIPIDRKLTSVWVPVLQSYPRDGIKCSITLAGPNRVILSPA